MASAAYETILAVQALDLGLIRLRHRLATHPLRAEVAAADAARGEAEATLAVVADEIHALDRTAKRLADEVAGISSKRADIDRRLYGGTVTASKELLALQDEAASLLDRQRGIEDQELEIMEQQEELDRRRTEAAAVLRAATAGLDGAAAALEAAIAEIESEIVDVEVRRAEAAALAAPELLATYAELAPQFGGVAVARLVDGHCDGCHIQLSAMARDRINRAPSDAVVTCEECGRLLVR